MTVKQSKAIRFTPSEYQQGRNESDAPVHMLALGEPQETTDIQIALQCQK